MPQVMKNGMIFSIEEFAIHDGPGIRTTIFLKGCPLRCTWCHNPEGISPKPQKMKKNGQIVTSGYEISPEELANQILRNKDIYAMNRGGVTFTGGEPLLQSDFLMAVLDLIGPAVHTAIETSGYASTDIFKRVTQKVDLVMMDVKHTDPVVHKKYTGVENDIILANLDYLCSSTTKFIIRIPLIPGVNDSEENMLNIAELIQNAKSMIRVELLPYNQVAGAKYPMIGQTFTPLFDPTRKPEIHHTVFEKLNIKTIVL